MVSENVSSTIFPCAQSRAHAELGSHFVPQLATLMLSLINPRNIYFTLFSLLSHWFWKVKFKAIGDLSTSKKILILRMV